MLWWWSLAHAASTCAQPPGELAVDPSSQDRSPPAAPVLSGFLVERGQAPSQGLEVDECSGLGAITLTLQASSGSGSGTTGAEAVGYLLRLTDGDLPDGMEALPAFPLSGPEVVLTWDDGATDDQDAFFFEVELTAVDAAGNHGGTLLVEVADDGIAAAACDTAPASSLGALGLLAPLLGLRRRVRGIRPRARA